MLNLRPDLPDGSKEALYAVRARSRRALVICSGTGSVDQALHRLGYEVYSCDMDAEWGADFVCDVAQLRARLESDGWKPGDF